MVMFIKCRKARWMLLSQLVANLPDLSSIPRDPHSSLTKLIKQSSVRPLPLKEIALRSLL